MRTSWDILSFLSPKFTKTNNMHLKLLQRNWKLQNPVYKNTTKSCVMKTFPERPSINVKLNVSLQIASPIQILYVFSGKYQYI